MNHPECRFCGRKMKNNFGYYSCIQNSHRYNTCGNIIDESSLTISKYIIDFSSSRGTILFFNTNGVSFSSKIREVPYSKDIFFSSKEEIENFLIL